MECRVELLGQPRVLWNGEVYPFSAPPRTLPLLAYILLQRDGPIHRTIAARDLWGSESDDARANLRRHIAYLKAAMPSPDIGGLKTTAKTLRWETTPAFTFDVTDFEQLSAGDDYESAIPLYRGELMETYSFHWLEDHRSRARALQLLNLQRAATNAMESGSNLQAADLATKMLVLDPWREDALRIAVQTRFALGDRIGAVQQYEAFVERLRDEMRLEPLPQTRAVYEQLMGS